MADVTNPTKTSLGELIPFRYVDLDGTEYAPATAPQFADTVLDLTLSCDSSGAYADGDVLAATQALAGAGRIEAGAGFIQSVMVLDVDDQGVAMDIIFMDANVSIGTENAAVSIADSDAVAIVGIVNVLASDYVDMINSQVATVTSIGMAYQCAAATTSLYVGVVTRGGTPTHEGAGVSLKIGLLRN